MQAREPKIFGARSSSGLMMAAPLKNRWPTFALGCRASRSSCFSIIDACPLDKHAQHPNLRRERLDAAMAALIGKKSSRNPLPGDRDEQALLWMADQGAYLSQKSDLRLATEAAKKFFGDDSLVKPE